MSISLPAFVRKCQEVSPWCAGMGLRAPGGWVHPWLWSWFSSAPPSHFCLLLVPCLALLPGLGVCGRSCIEAHLAETPATLQTL